MNKPRHHTTYIHGLRFVVLAHVYGKVLTFLIVLVVVTPSNSSHPRKGMFTTRLLWTVITIIVCFVIVLRVKRAYNIHGKVQQTYNAYQINPCDVRFRTPFREYINVSYTTTH